MGQPNRSLGARSVRSAADAGGAAGAPRSAARGFLYGKGPIFRFVGMFIVLMTVFYVCALTDPMNKRLLPYYMELNARMSGISFVAANPRHEHEYAVWNSIRLPEDKYLMPGVIDSTTNFIEHPDLVAERILRFAEVHGPSRVLASTDCGFGTFAGVATVDPAIAWAKLDALVHGAKRASTRLRPRRPSEQPRESRPAH